MNTTPAHFIAVRSQPGCTYHATIRASQKPWTVCATCTNTSGPLFAAEAAARKFGFRGYRVELVPHDQWNDATNGWLSSKRPGFTPSAITHIYRLAR